MADKPIYPSGALPVSERILPAYKNAWRVLVDNSDSDLPVRVEQLVCSTSSADPVVLKLAYGRDPAVAVVARYEIAADARMLMPRDSLGVPGGARLLACVPGNVPDWETVDITGWAIHFRPTGEEV
jgi:hypothetical protein